MQDIMEIIEKFEANNWEFSSANSYGEPGYDLGDKQGIILSNWNDVDQADKDELEKEFELEWSDEWLIDYDDDCKAYRTSSDSYDWTPSFQLDDCGNIWTKSTATDDVEGYLEMIINNSRQSNLLLSEKQVQEAGFHPPRQRALLAESLWESLEDPFEAPGDCVIGGSTPVGYYDGTTKGGGFVTEPNTFMGVQCWAELICEHVAMPAGAFATFDECVADGLLNG